MSNSATEPSNAQVMEDRQCESPPSIQRAEGPLSAGELNSLAELYIQQNRADRALIQYHRAIAQATTDSLPLEMLRSWAGMAAIYRRQGRFEQVVECHQEALKVAQGVGDPNLEARHLNFLGSAYMLAGKFPAAIQSHSNALQLYTSKNLVGSAASLKGMALAHHKLGEVNKAADVYQQMVDLLAPAPTETYYLALATACMGLGGCYSKQEKYEVAADHVERALTLALANKDDQLALEANLSLGNLQLSLGRPQIALEHYQRALDMAEANSDARNQCRSLCGAGLCYYVSGEAHGAAKLFQNALAYDTRVPQSGASKAPSIGDQIVDEQLLVLLHRLLREHAPQGATRDVMGTMYLGLSAVVMNGGGVLTPSSLPLGLVDTVIRSLLVAAGPEEVSATCARYTPYLQHYCMHVLQQLVYQRSLRHLMLNQAAIDAVLACMAFPIGPAEGASGMQSHTAACKILRGLLNSPPAGSTRDDICDLILHSPQMWVVLDILPRRCKPPHEARVKQVLDILSALAALITISGGAPKGPLTPPHLPQRQSLSGKLPPSVVQDITTVIGAVCEVIRVMLDSESCTETDLQILEPCIRALVQNCKRTSSSKVLVFRKLEAQRLERLNTGYIPESSAVFPLAMDLCRLLKDFLDLRSNAGLGVRSEDAVTTIDDTTTHDQDTTFDSLSSHSSLMYSGLRPTVSVHKLPIGGEAALPVEDTEGLDDASWMDEWMSS